jgi:hypothetical protein
MMRDRKVDPWLLAVMLGCFVYSLVTVVLHALR